MALGLNNVDGSDRISVVGEVEHGTTGPRAVLWERDDMDSWTVTLLDDSIWVTTCPVGFFRIAYDVNDAGEIVGEAFVDGIRQAILPIPLETPVCIGDVTDSTSTGPPDGVTNVFDLFYVIPRIGQPCCAVGEPCRADIANFSGYVADGVVDVFDLLAVIAFIGCGSESFTSEGLSSEMQACIDLYGTVENFDADALLECLHEAMEE